MRAAALKPLALTLLWGLEAVGSLKKPRPNRIWEAAGMGPGTPKC